MNKTRHEIHIYWTHADLLTRVGVSLSTIGFLGILTQERNTLLLCYIHLLDTVSKQPC